jgi:WD40 repeat protein
MMRASVWLVFTGMLLTYKGVGAADCSSIKGIASNDVVTLTGSRDTLWTLTFEEPDRYAVNTLSGDGNLSAKISDESNWNALYLCNTKSIVSMAYKAGMTVAITDTVWHKPNDILVFSKTDGTIKRRSVSFDWPGAVVNNDSMHVCAVDMTTDGKYFYFACLDGGVVQWDPITQKTMLFIPGMPPKPIESLVSDSMPDPKKRVTSVSTVNNDLLVITPGKVWKYTFDTQEWDSTITSAIDRSSYTFSSFYSAFINTREKKAPFYGMINVKEGTQKDTMILCKYDTAAHNWRVFMDKAPTSMTTGHDGILYMVFEGNRLEAFIDTSEIGATTVNPAPIVAQSAFQDSMIRAFEIEYPEHITNILYTDLTDSTGNLWIATSEGLFLSQNVNPKKIIRSCNLVKRAPSVASGLKKTYARPGILKSGIQDMKSSRAVFVYNLSKDARVTIRVYDYNMDHVKTVIDGKFRKAGNNGGPMGRSTVESEDYWDGKTEGGKLVAPGIYYYKITTDKGERAFGKMIVAK